MQDGLTILGRLRAFPTVSFRAVGFFLAANGGYLEI